MQTATGRLIPVVLVPPVPRRCLLAALALALCHCPAAPAQERPPLRLNGVGIAGVRGSVTESWGTFGIHLTNLSDGDRQARVLAFYEGQSEVQYGRDVWVPARSSFSTWMLVGPAPAQQAPNRRDFQILISDRTGGKDQLLASPEGRVRSGRALYRKREPSTAVLVDEGEPGPAKEGRLPGPEPAADEVLRFAHVFRSAGKLPEPVHRVDPGLLPPTAEAFDGIDHFVIASGRVARDPVGLRALRHWLGQGGKVWVLLDRLEPESLSPILGALLGEALDFTVVDRVGLTAFAVAALSAGRDAPAPPEEGQRHDQPVDFVRVLLPPAELARHTVNGWPVWFTRPVGRGKVLFTTLGARGWYRPRTDTDPKSPYKNLPSLPVPTTTLEIAANELLPPREASPFQAEAFRPIVAGEIGYAVIGRGTAGLVFGALLLTLLTLGVVLRRWRRPELLGWLAPTAALAAAAVFVALGESSRRAVPPTVAVAQIVDAVPGSGEVAVHGLLAVYRPDSGPAAAGAEQGGLFELDMRGVEGPTRRLLLTDRDTWHWENLSLPAGVHWAPFRFTGPTGKPLTAVARFGPGGIEGRLAAGPFEDLADAVLATPGDRNLAVQLRPDGTFQAGPGDVLPPGQFLPAAVLSDAQQQRQGLYRQFLGRRGAGSEGRTLLLAWARPIDTHFRFAPGARTVGTALLIVPLQVDRPAPGTRLTIPGPLVTAQRVVRGAPTRLMREGSEGVTMDLRFQLPRAVLPFEVERVRLNARVDAPARQVSVAGRADSKAVEVYRAESPLDPLRIDVAEASLLVPDRGGGLHFALTVSDPVSGEGAGKTDAWRKAKWTIEYIELEVVGRCRGNPNR